jgi:hypothetical protein
MAMATLLLERPTPTNTLSELPQRSEDIQDLGRWLIFRYSPVALFSLKSSRATSTAGKTLLTPTPYAVKMAFLDTALRNGLTYDPQDFVRCLARTILRIGVPHHACVTGTIQSIRQETREAERGLRPDLPPYRPSIAFREFVHYQGVISLAFDLKTCSVDYVPLLLEAAPAINYLGRRGSFVQYLNGARQPELDSTFTQAVDAASERTARFGQRILLDDFGPEASFQNLNSFASTAIRRGADRKFVETIIPLQVYNSGPGFAHYVAAATAG